MGVTLGRLLLVALCVVTSALAVARAPQRPPAPGAETTLWLAATSWAEDGDGLRTDADMQRYRARFAAEPRGVEMAATGDALAAPWLAARAWGAAARWGGELGLWGFNLLLFWGTAALGWWATRQVWGALAPLWIAVLLFGSVAFTFLFRLQPELLGLASVVAASALVWSRFAVAPAKGVYGGEFAAPQVAFRWLAAGLVFGLAATLSPAYLPLAVPLLAAAPRGRRSIGGATFVIGLAATVGGAALLGGVPWAMPSWVFSPALLGWNGFYLLVGRNAGILAGYLPVLLLLAVPSSEAGRRWLPAAALAAAALQLTLYPFDWAGDLAAVGNAWFLPVFGALWFLPGRIERPRWAVVLLLVAAPLLLPRWWQPLSDGTVAPAAIRRFTEAARTALPFETTLRTLPGAHEIARGGVRLRATSWNVFPTSSGLAWQGSRAGELAVASDRPLSSLRLAFGEKGPSALQIRGGEAGNTTFRPGGEVAFDVRLGRPARRHPVWWSRQPVAIYFLRLELPQAPLAPIPFDLELARPALPAPERP